MTQGGERKRGEYLLFLWLFASVITMGGRSGREPVQDGAHTSEDVIGSLISGVAEHIISFIGLYFKSGDAARVKGGSKKELTGYGLLYSDVAFLNTV